MSKKALIESLKELGRIVLVAILPIVYSGLNTQTGDINISWKIVGVVAILAIIKSIDKFVHEVGVENDNDKLKTGLTGF